MTIHVNVGEAKTRLSQLIAAALKGEDVVVDKDGKPQVRLVPIEEASQEERERLAEKRRAAIGKWAKHFEGFDITPDEIKKDRQYSEARRKLYGDDLR